MPTYRQETYELVCSSRLRVNSDAQRQWLIKYLPSGVQYIVKAGQNSFWHETAMPTVTAGCPGGSCASSCCTVCAASTAMRSPSSSSSSPLSGCRVKYTSRSPSPSMLAHLDAGRVQFQYYSYYVHRKKVSAQFAHAILRPASTCIRFPNRSTLHCRRRRWRHTSRLAQWDRSPPAGRAPSAHGPTRSRR